MMGLDNGNVEHIQVLEVNSMRITLSNYQYIS